MKNEKPKWYFNKFLKAKYDNKKKFNLIIKNSEKDKVGYNLLVKDNQMHKILKDKRKIEDVQNQLKLFTINRELTKELKEENDTFLKKLSNMKRFKKIYSKNHDENFDIYQKLEELILKYKQKGYNKIPKLNENVNNIFKQEPILSKSNVREMFESVLFNPKSRKNLLFLKKIKTYIDDLIQNIENKNNKKENLKVNEIEKENLQRKRRSYTKITNNQILNNSRSKSMSNVTIKTDYTLLNKNQEEKKLIKKKLFEKNIHNVSKKNYDSYIKENESSFINGIRYYNEEEKKIILEINELLDNIKNAENETLNNQKFRSLKNAFSPIKQARRKSLDINFDKKLFKRNLTLEKIKINNQISKNLNYNLKNKNDKINIINNKEDVKLPFINKNMKNKMLLKFEAFQNEEEFFNYAFEETKKYEIKNVFYMLKLFLEKFRNLSIEEIDKIINLEDKNPLSILEKIREIKQIISKKRIIDKTRAIYLRNSSLESINSKIKLLSENENEIYKMDKHYIKILNQNQ